MAQTIKLRRSATSGAQPTTSQIELGELALNTYDGKVYMKKSVGGTESIVEVTGGSGSSAGGALYTDEFSGDGSTTGFTLSVAPVSEDDLIVFIDGVYQNLNSYSISGTTLTFDTAPDNGTTVIVHHFQGGILGTAPVIDTMTGDGSDTTLTLSIAPSSENQTFVTFDGVFQHKSTYSVSGTTLTFSEAVPNGVTVECVTFRNVQVATFEDADGDTKIQVEESADEDTIRFDVAGTEIATMTGDGLTFADSSKAIFGAGSDLQISHDGTRSIINDAGTGDLQFQIGGSAIFDVTTAGIVLEGFPESSYELKGDIDGGIRFTVQAGEALSKGDVVYISGAAGDNTVVSKAQANSASTMPAFGFVLADIANGGSGQVVTFGNIYGSGSAALDTSSCSIGDAIYVSATTAGAFTKTAPTGESNLVQNIGKILRVATSNGVIKVGGAGRTNATPNLDQDQFFLGNASNQAVAVDFSDSVESYLDGGTSTPTFASATVSGDLTVDTNTLYVDSSNNRVGIGTSSPAFTSGSGLEIERGGTTTLRLQNTAAARTVEFNMGTDLEIKCLNTGSDIILTPTANVGIGTTSPDLKLHVAHSDSNNGLLLEHTSQASGHQYLLNARETEGLIFQRWTNGSFSSNTMTLDYNNRVGIGTTVPSQALTVSNTSGGISALIQTSTTGTGNLLFGDTDSDTSGRVQYQHTDNLMAFHTNGSERMRIDSTGDIFINNTSFDLSGVLQVSNTNDNSEVNLIVAESERTGIVGAGLVLHHKSTSPAANDYNFITFSGKDAGDDNTSYAQIQGLIDDTTAGAEQGNLAFLVSNAGSLAERMRIDHSGNVGIGVASPSKPLHIYSASDTAIRLQNSTTGTGTTDGLLLEQNGSDSLLVNYEAGNIRLLTSGSERMRITDAGRVGIGYTSITSYKFAVNGTAYINNGIYLPDGSAASPIYTFDSDSNTGLFRATTDTLGFSTAGTERMRIASDGSIGVNTSSPISLGGHDGVVTLYGSNATALILQNSTSSSRLAQLGSDLGFFVATYETERMRLTSTGLGIGTTSPDTVLDVTSSGANGIVLNQDTANSNVSGRLFFKDTNGTNAILNISGGLGFFTGGTVGSDTGTERLRIDSSGRLGIGYASPANPLSVSGVISSGNTTGVGVGGTPSDANFGELGPGYLNLARDDTASARQITFGKNGAVHSYLETTTSGLNIGGANVGIGTTSPTAALTVSGTSTASAIDFTNTTASTGRSYRWVSHNAGSFKIEDMSASGAERLRVESDGDVSIGGIAPQTKLDVDGSILIRASGSSKSEMGIFFREDFVNSNKYNCSIFAHDHSGSFSDGISINGSDGISFCTGSNSRNERARFDINGRFTIGETSALSFGDFGVKFNGTTSNGIVLETTRDATGSTFIRFNDSDSAAIGSIYQDGASSVTYATTSDYRLKENIIYDWSALDRLNQLKPAQFNFIGDNRTINGFIAHEVQNIVPEAIVGEKDAVNEDGSIKPQNIDKSRLVPLLVKAVQEQQEQIESLKREIGILKGEIND